MADKRGGAGQTKTKVNESAVPIRMILLPPVRCDTASASSRHNESQPLRETLPNFPVRPAYEGEPTALEKADGEKRLGLVIEILAEADLQRLQELIDRQSESSATGEGK